MFESRRKKIRRWHERRVLHPFEIRLEHGSAGTFFLQKMEARWSASRRKWLWRLPAGLGADTSS